MRILGIDPGLRTTGFGVIEYRQGKSHYIASGCIRTQTGALPARLKILLEGVTEVIQLYRPVQTVVEKVFVNVNPQSTLLLGQARGVAIAAAVLANLPVAEYTALQIKQSVVGHGHADKIQVQAMIKYLLKLEGTPQSDAADALAAALCYTHHAGSAFQGFTKQGLTIKRGRLA